MSSQGGCLRFLVALLMPFVGALTSSVSAAFVFSSPTSRLQFNDASSKFFVDTPISGFNGTLVLVDNSAARVQGASGTISFNAGFLEQGTSSILLTGEYQGASTDTILLGGSNRMRAFPGTLLPGVTCAGNNNFIEGAPLFSGAITLADVNTTVTIAITNKLNANVVLNNGTVVLGNSLALDDNVTFVGAGNIDFGMRGLALPGRDTTWTGTICMINAAPLQLESPVKLSGTWRFASSAFGASQTMSRSVFDGHGQILDLSTCGTIWVGAGHTLEITNCVIKGLASQDGAGGGASNAQGFFLMEDQYSTVSFNGCVLQLSGNYTLTQGTFYFYGSSSTIETGSYTFRANNALNGAVVKVDGVTLSYDTLAAPDVSNVLQPDGINLISLNGGQVKGAKAVAPIYIDTPFYQQLTNESVSGLNRLISFRGNSASNMTWNGGGCSVSFARGTGQAGSLAVAAGKTVTLENVVLKDFSSACCALGANSALYFGNGVTIELGANEDLSMTWSFTGQATPSIIRGVGNTLNLGGLGVGNYVGIAVGVPNAASNSSVTLWLNDVKLMGLQGGVSLDTLVSNKATYSTNAAYVASRNLLRCVNYGDVINLRNSEINLSGNYTLSAGSINIYNDVSIKGSSYKFAFSSNGTLAIQSASTLFVDRAVTFSYDSSGLGDRGGGASKNQLTMADVTSRLFLNGCTFYATLTAPKLQTGVLVVSDKVTLQSEGTVDANATVFSDAGSLRVEVLGGGTLDVFGAFAYQ